MASDQKSRFTGKDKETKRPKTSEVRAFSGVFVAVSDTREAVSQEIQEHITTLAVDILENAEDERQRAILDITQKAEQAAQDWQAIDAEAFAADNIEGDSFPEEIKDKIIMDPVGFIAEQVKAIKETRDQALAEVESKDAANLAASKIQQIMDQAGVSSDPTLLQKLKQEIEKRTQVTLPEMQNTKTKTQKQQTSVTSRGKM